VGLNLDQTANPAGRGPLRLIGGSTNEWQISRGAEPHARNDTRCWFLRCCYWIMPVDQTADPAGRLGGPLCLIGGAHYPCPMVFHGFSAQPMGHLVPKQPAPYMPNKVKFRFRNNNFFRWMQQAIKKNTNNSNKSSRNVQGKYMKQEQATYIFSCAGCLWPPAPVFCDCIREVPFMHLHFE
jgi:hypothetical protein